MNFQNIKVIGFDLDQTLYPKSPEIDEAIQIYLYQKIAEHLGISIEVAENKFKEITQEMSDYADEHCDEIDLLKKLVGYSNSFYFRIDNSGSFNVGYK